MPLKVCICTCYRLYILLAIYVSYVYATENPSELCAARQWKKVGCFRDNFSAKSERVYPYELVNHRDRHSPRWDGHTLDWYKWPQSLHELTCDCAKKTQKRGFQYFGLQFYGECWSGPSTEFDRDGTSGDCIGDDYKPCSDVSASECVGKASTNYVYALADTVTVDGRWTTWTSWTSCSVSCNGGKRSRERECTNPKPSSGGRNCDGDATMTESCNTDVCTPMCEGKMDVGIILDASTSVTRKHWYKMLKFVTKLSREFEIGLDNVHFGIVRFSSVPSLQISITDSTYFERNSFEQKLSTIKYTYGRTRTDLAIKMAEKKLMCKQCGTRQHVYKALLVLTDGFTSRDTVSMVTVTNQLRKDNVKMVAVAVGHDINRDGLSAIATDEKHVLALNSYKDLNEAVNRIVKLLCV